MATAVVDRAGKYLVFQLGKEEYGIEVLRVKEIMGLKDVTPIPHTPNHVRGVINLRGKIVPVVDLRVKFGLPVADEQSRNCIVVVQLPGGSEGLLVGITVDAVADVLNVAEAEIEPTPDFGVEVDTGFLIGIAKVKGAVKLLLDIEKTIGVNDLRSLSLS